jgi:hypothetical protein
MRVNGINVTSEKPANATTGERGDGHVMHSGSVMLKK